MLLRKALPSDLPFLREMLYEAVYWRAIASDSNPSLEVGLAAPAVNRALVGWGERDGDAAVISSVNSNPTGAAWYRFYSEENCIRGYIKDTIPALVVAVNRESRGQGVGQKLIEWLIDHASQQNIQEISLMVSKDNPALNLYSRCGFLAYTDKGDSLLMLRKI